MSYNLDKQHEKGKYHAIERINELCDKDSFVEIYSGVRHNCTSFGMEKKDIPYDGVITGFGKIGWRRMMSTLVSVIIVGHWSFRMKI